MGIKQILKIPVGYKIIRFEETLETLEIYIEPYKNKKAVCSGCGKIHKEGYRGVEEMKLLDLPSGERKVYLHVSKRRYLCPKDRRIYVEHIEWVKKRRYADRFAKDVYRLTHLPQFTLKFNRISP